MPPHGGISQVSSADSFSAWRCLKIGDKVLSPRCIRIPSPRAPRLNLSGINYEDARRGSQSDRQNDYLGSGGGRSRDLAFCHVASAGPLHAERLRRILGQSHAKAASLCAVCDIGKGSAALSREVFSRRRSFISQEAEREALCPSHLRPPRTSPFRCRIDSRSACLFDCQCLG